MKCETCKHIDHELSHISDGLWDVRCNAGDWKNDTLIVEETLPWVTDIVCRRSDCRKRRRKMTKEMTLDEQILWRLSNAEREIHEARALIILKGIKEKEGEK